MGYKACRLVHQPHAGPVPMTSNGSTSSTLTSRPWLPVRAPLSHSVVTDAARPLDHSGMPELLESSGDIPLVAITRASGAGRPTRTDGHQSTMDCPGATALQRRPGAISRSLVASHRRRCADASSWHADRPATEDGCQGLRPAEHEHFAEVVEPAIQDGVVTFLGELGPPERDALYAGAAATLMLGAWPEPFGLVPSSRWPRNAGHRAPRRRV